MTRPVCGRPGRPECKRLGRATAVRRGGGPICAAAALALALAGCAAIAPEARADDLVIGYLELKRDARYTKKRRYARFLGQALGRPYDGARVALDEVKFHGAAIGVEFKLEKARAKSAAGMLGKAKKLYGQGARLFVVDAPAGAVSGLAKGMADSDALLFNVSAYDDALREEACAANLMHVIPSHTMVMDALSQYLVSKKWNRVLLLHGGLPEDGKRVAAFERSAKRFGIKIDEAREFVLSNDPREREKNNVALLTGRAKFDVIVVIDSQGEFARDVPYSTVEPSLVVGSEGLAAVAWHWAWERHGAPQLINRFAKKAKRPMGSVDWAAWMAVKAIAEAVQRTGSADVSAIKAHLTHPDAVIDGFKGNRLGFRPWNNQLRQPMLLVTHNWVVERAPLAGFLHRKNNLDTMGVDEPESTCKLGDVQ